MQTDSRSFDTKRWVMKKLTGKLAVLVLGISSALSLSALAQTTDEGPGPSEQPSAPMEIGQAQPPNAQAPDAQAPR